MRLLIIWSALVFAITGCNTTTVKTYHNKYLAMWERQLDDYRAKFVEQDTQIRLKASSYVKASTTDEPDKYWSSLVSRAMDIGSEVRGAFITAGRGESTKAFIAHMSTEPTPGMSDAWFQRQTSDAVENAKVVDSKTADFFSQFDNKLQQGLGWMMELEELAKEQGMVQGRIQELDSLYKQAELYYREQQVALAEDAQRMQQQQLASQRLFAAMAYVNQLNYQQQLVNTLNRPRTCTVWRNTIQCF